MARHSDPDDFNGVRDEVVRLRCEGRGYEYIASAVGISDNRVRKILRQEFETYLGERQQVIGEVDLQYQFLYTKFFEQLQKRGFADAQLGKLVLQTLLDRRKLLGLDAPNQVQVTHSLDELSLDEINQRIAQLDRVALPPKVEVIEVAEFEVKKTPAPAQPPVSNSDGLPVAQPGD